MTEYYCQSNDLCLEKYEGEEEFVEKLQREYIACKAHISLRAEQDNVLPENLSYKMQFMRCKWDLCFVLTATATQLQPRCAVCGEPIITFLTDESLWDGCIYGCVIGDTNT